jgi:hypothetical protein
MLSGEYVCLCIRIQKVRRHGRGRVMLQYIYIYIYILLLHETFELISRPELEPDNLPGKFVW